MKTALFAPGIRLESNTAYVYDKPLLDIRREDTVLIENRAAFTGIFEHDIPIDGCNPFDVAYFAEDLENVTIDLGGATLLFYGSIQPFIFRNCKNVTLKNFSVQYERSHFSEFDILEMDEHHILLKKDPVRFPMRIENGNIIFTGEDWESDELRRHPCFFQIFNKTTCDGISAIVATAGADIVSPGDVFRAPDTFSVVDEGENFRLAGDVAPWFVDAYRGIPEEDGALFYIGHEARRFSAFKIYGCENTVIENVRIINGSGLGLETFHCHDIAIRGYKLFRDERSVSTVTNSADAIHCVATSGRITIEDSVICNMEDDAVNIHGNFCMVEEVRDNIITASVSRYSSSSLCKTFDIGDRVVFHRGQTMEEIGENVLTAIEPIDHKTLKMTFADPVAGVGAGDNVENLSCCCDLIVRNCVFDHAISHLRIQTRGKVRFSDCTFGLPLLLTGDLNCWLESGPVKDMTVENCTFRGECAIIHLTPEVFPTEKAPYYHENVTVIGSRFDAGCPVLAHEGNNIVFRGNTNTRGLPMHLELINCGTADADVEIVRRTEEKTELMR